MVEKIQQHRAKVSDDLFNRAYQQKTSRNDPVYRVETWDRGNDNKFTPYCMIANPTEGIMTLEQAYHDIVKEKNKVLPYSVFSNNA
ncbi:MAG TPA: hypothetical protein VL461_09605 [Dictyobacter sp.]|jgi:hypothetical protein|nr:hypothetical protein [Dictyobacter sp.]